MSRRCMPVLATAVIMMAFGCGKDESAGGGPGAITGDRSGGSNGLAASIEPSSGGKLILIKGGAFTMGARSGRPDETPHPVTVDGFYMDVHPVTQAMYRKVMGANPAKWKDPKYPVERVKWAMAAAFCNKASELDGLTPCYDLETQACNYDADGYRLPTEAEWEYACRAGSETTYFFGDTADALDGFAWYKQNSEGRPREVAVKKPNAWGLFDMAGGVWEWTGDWYDADYYKASPKVNPRGPANGTRRVLRGGAWNSPAKRCTATYRFKEFPDYSTACFGYDAYGFRRVRRLPVDTSADASDK